METVDSLNEQLVKRFGSLDGKPRFRIIWSEDVQEVRLSSFHSGIHLSTPIAEKRPKYMYLKNRYVLEMALAGAAHKDVLTEDKITYEPIYVFQNPKTQDPLPPIWVVCEIMARYYLEIVYKERPYVKKEAAYEEEKKEAIRVEAAEFKDILANEAPNLSNGFGVTVPSNFERSSNE